MNGEWYSLGNNIITQMKVKNNIIYKLGKVGYQIPYQTVAKVWKNTERRLSNQ